MLKSQRPAFGAEVAWARWQLRQATWLLDSGPDCDVVVIAIGTTPNPLVPRTTTGLETTRHGTVVVKDEATGRTTKDRVWAGGDVVTGAATVISAMGAGKRAAADMDAFLRGA